VITIAMSAVIEAPRERVWRALSQPRERIRWDTRILSLTRPVPDYPHGEQAAHWRYQLGSVPVELVDQPVEVVPGKRLRHALSIGSFRFEQTYTLSEESERGEKTRLSLRFSAPENTVPVVGGALDRFDLRRLASEIVDDNLRALQRWCESGPGAELHTSPDR
jgi:uncharacterized protein YndB with AHSA1/START domain